MKKNTYGEWLNNWLTVYKKSYIKSWRDIKRDIELHVPQSVKSIPLNNLTAFDIQKALLTVKTSRTRVQLFDVYHGSLSMAYRVGLLDKDISAALIKPVHKRKLGAALSRSELDDFLKNIRGSRLQGYYQFCLLTGCRRSEALAVRWCDIDFIKNRVHICGTKTELSDRYIPLFPELRTVISQIPHKGDYLFTHSKYFVTSKFKKYCPAHKLHDLRHTFATRCLECGISMKVVQCWLGHARLDTTASIYSHLLPDFFQSESEKFKMF